MVRRAIPHMGYGLFFILLAFGTGLASEEAAAFQKTLKVQGRAGLNISKLSESGDGYGYSPEAAAGIQALLLPRMGIDLFIGYTQTRLPVQTGILRADFFKSGLYFSYRHPMKFIQPYLFAGGYAQMKFTAEFEEKSTSVVYDMSEYFNSLSYGASAGLGGEIDFLIVSAFMEVSYSKGLAPAIKSINSSLLKLNASSDDSIQIYAGARMPFYRI